MLCQIFYDSHGTALTQTLHLGLADVDSDRSALSFIVCDLCVKDAIVFSIKTKC